jgi:WD40 repeat protein
MFQKTARVREAWTSRLVFETSPSDLTSVAFSPDSRQIATGGSDGLVQVWDIESGQRVGDPMRNTAPVELIRFSPDGRHLV